MTTATFEFGGSVFEEIRLPCNAEAMTTLVEALKSGKFPQGMSFLRNPGGYCCLGVACETLTPGGRWVPFYDGGQNLENYNFAYGDVLELSYYMPLVTAEKLGIPLVTHGGSTMTGYDIQVSGRRLDGSPALDLGRNSFLTASVMNDGGASFPAIADRLTAVYL